MRPEDDMNWVVCIPHSVRHWCDWTANHLRVGLDANSGFDEFMRYCVPVVPDLGLYAEVSVGEEIIPGMAHELALVITMDSFSKEEELIPLGLLTNGEGRLVMSSAVQDWANGYADPKCITVSHGFAEEMILQNVIQKDPMQSKANTWCMAAHKCCYACWKAAEGKAHGGSDVSMNPVSYGVDPDEFLRSGSTSPTFNSRQQRTRDALNARFGN